MCHDDASRPPAPPRSGEVADRRTLVLEAADGNRFAAASATPSVPARVGVVVLPDVRGLHPYYVALTERLAEAGLAAVALDWFGRTAGLPEDGVRGEDFAWQDEIARTTPAGIDADVTAAVAHLRGQAHADLPVVVVGFCFGGSHAWRLSGADVDVAGCVGFYGRPSMVETVDAARRPTVMLIAGADAATPVDESLELAARMRAAGADVDAVVLDGAPHSFFDRSFAEHALACATAWEHLLALTDRVAAGR